MIIEPKASKQRSGREARPRFRGLVHYMLRGKGAERCTWYMAQNLPGLDRREDAETAIKVVEAYQRRNTRAKSDKTYHLVISLHPDDRSLREAELEEVVRRAVQAAGLEEHAYIAVRHSDQEHEHVHVAVSKIHPRTLKIHHPWKDIARFKDLASEFEEELGLHQVDRSQDKNRSARSHGARHFEAAQGEGLHCKASALGREWSKPRLAARYGEFVPGPDQEQVRERQQAPYKPTPLGPLRDDGLWQEYQRRRTETGRGAQARQDLDRVANRERDAHRTRFTLRHHMIQSLPIANRDKRTLYKAMRIERVAAEGSLRAKIEKRRRVARSVPRTPTWKEFLAERAEKGDPRALRRLARERDPSVVAIRSSRRDALPLGGPRTSRGTLVHHIGRGARIRESPGLLELVGDSSPEALAQLVGFAVERFQGRRIRLLGSRELTEQLEPLIRSRDLRVERERGRGR